MFHIELSAVKVYNCEGSYDLSQHPTVTKLLELGMIRQHLSSPSHFQMRGVGPEIKNVFKFP